MRADILWDKKAIRSRRKREHQRLSAQVSRKMQPVNGRSGSGGTSFQAGPVTESPWAKMPPGYLRTNSGPTRCDVPEYDSRGFHAVASLKIFTAAGARDRRVLRIISLRSLFLLNLILEGMGRPAVKRTLVNSSTHNIQHPPVPCSTFGRPAINHA
jgi:hypothetical protein